MADFFEGQVPKGAHYWSFICLVCAYMTIHRTHLISVNTENTPSQKHRGSGNIDSEILNANQRGKIPLSIPITS